MTPARYKSEFPWLKEVDSLALCNAQMHHFFHDVSVGFPKFRSKKKPVKSYTTNCVNGNTVLQNGRLKLPKAGWVRIRQHRKIEEGYQLKGATITQEADERYTIVLCIFLRGTGERRLRRLHDPRVVLIFHEEVICSFQCKSFWHILIFSQKLSEEAGKGSQTGDPHTGTK